MLKGKTCKCKKTKKPTGRRTQTYTRKHPWVIDTPGYQLEKSSKEGTWEVEVTGSKTVFSVIYCYYFW